MVVSYTEVRRNIRLNHTVKVSIVLHLFTFSLKGSLPINEKICHYLLCNLMFFQTCITFICLWNTNYGELIAWKRATGTNK